MNFTKNWLGATAAVVLSFAATPALAINLAGEIVESLLRSGRVSPSHFAELRDLQLDIAEANGVARDLLQIEKPYLTINWLSDIAANIVHLKEDEKSLMIILKPRIAGHDRLHDVLAKIDALSFEIPESVIHMTAPPEQRSVVVWVRWKRTKNPPELSKTLNRHRSSDFSQVINQRFQTETGIAWAISLPQHYSARADVSAYLVNPELSPEMFSHLMGYFVRP